MVFLMGIIVNFFVFGGLFCRVVGFLSEVFLFI